MRENANDERANTFHERDKDDQEDSLPEHTHHMRKAAEHIRTALSATALGGNLSHTLFSCWSTEASATWKKICKEKEKNSFIAQRKIRREKAQCSFWNSLPNTPKDCDGERRHRRSERQENRRKDDDTIVNASFFIPHRHFNHTDDGSNWKALSLEDFQRDFQSRNLPCLITFPLFDSQNPFHKLHQEWTVGATEGRRHDQILVGNKTVDANLNTQINREWFRSHLGKNSTVPVRYQQSTSSSPSPLDEDGRAMECRTEHMSIDVWIEKLQRIQNDCVDLESSFPYYNYYLKDWHLQLQWEQHATKTNEETVIDEQELSSLTCLYQCPSIFGIDILNSFLRRFTSGDYRFCYWGPKGSFTSRHSDVLHSFSWSYNICGTKEWTFFEKEHTKGADISAKPKTFKVIQKAGQAMFVPSQWQHEVINLEETISVNHNWVTHANIDLCWECLCEEMTSIHTELNLWGNSSMVQDPMAQESMLRGCVGLDVTAFILMILLRVTDIFTIYEHVATETCCGDSLSSLSYQQLEELRNLLEVLRLIRSTPDLDVASRITVVLRSHELSSVILELVDRLILLADNEHEIDYLLID